MHPRTRKFIGAAVMVGFVLVYALTAMVIAQSPAVQQASGLSQGIFYAVAGLSWIFPIMPLIRWMERKTPA